MCGLEIVACNRPDCAIPVDKGIPHVMQRSPERHLGPKENRKIIGQIPWSTVVEIEERCPAVIQDAGIEAVAISMTMRARQWTERRYSFRDAECNGFEFVECNCFRKEHAVAQSLQRTAQHMIEIEGVERVGGDMGSHCAASPRFCRWRGHRRSTPRRLRVPRVLQKVCPRAYPRALHHARTSRPHAFQSVSPPERFVSRGAIRIPFPS